MLLMIDRGTGEYSHATACVMFAAEAKPKDKKPMPCGRKGGIAGRFDKKIRDRCDDGNGSAESRSKKKLKIRSFYHE